MFSIKRTEDDRWVLDPDRNANDPRRYGPQDDRMTFATREQAAMLALGFEEVVPEPATSSTKQTP